MTRLAILALRIALAAVLLGTLFVQVLIIPLLASETAIANPEVDYLQLPYTIGAITVVVCVQVAIGCVWRLLGFVRAGSIFSPLAFRWVDAIVAAIGVAVSVLVVMFIHLSVIEAMPPAAFLFLIGGVVTGLCLALLVVVMRALLVRAAQLETDLSEVI